MKRKLITVAILLVIAMSFVLCACTKDTSTVVITASDEDFNFEGKTLVDFMNYLQDKGELTFEIKDGMLISVNGKAQTAGSYWMIYTDDAENANDAWGTYEYKDVTYGSAVAGVQELPIKENCTYLLVYQSFGL